MWLLILPIALSMSGAVHLVSGASGEPRPSVPRSIQYDDPSLVPEEPEAFLDAFLPLQMDRLHIPGLVVVVVKSGQIVFRKGYGFGNLEGRTSIDPDKTLFRVASVSKLVTSTAVMQLVERGFVQLDEDVNTYLDLFQIPSTHDSSVTLANLLTHTGGFDERYIGMAARRESEVLGLGPYLAARMPPRVRPPGDVVSYSNHGMALAGYVVEAVSGLGFADYVELNILRPLGMDDSTFRLQPEQASNLAAGYAYRNGEYRSLPFDYSHIPPAGSLVATATDMACFMMAHLESGGCGDGRILGPDTMREMHAPQWTHHPGLPGFAYGFYEHFENGRRLLAHGGNLGGFASGLYLMPEEDLGIFVTYNADRSELREDLIERFVDRYYPDWSTAEARPDPSTEAAFSAGAFDGTYRLHRYPRHTLDKWSVLSQARLEFHVSTSERGTLILRYPGESMEPAEYVQTEPLLFENVDGEDRVAFRQDSRGRVTDMFLQFSGPAALEKLPWYATSSFHSMLHGFLALVFLSVGAVWLRGRVDGRSKAHRSEKRLDWASRVAVRLVSGLNMVFLLGLPTVLALDPQGLTYGASLGVILLLAIPLLTTAMTPGLVFLNVLVWKRGRTTNIHRLHHSLVTLAAVAVIPYLMYWNLLGFRY